MYAQAQMMQRQQQLMMVQSQHNVYGQQMMPVMPGQPVVTMQPPMGMAQQVMPAYQNQAMMMQQQ